jgi:hypothetical protein
MTNENRIGLVGVESAISFVSQMVGADGGATLQSKRRFKKHRLRRSDQWHEWGKTKKQLAELSVH